mgnify:CR=1 FL=1
MLRRDRRCLSGRHRDRLTRADALATQERYTQKHGPRRASEGMMDTHALAISAAQPGTVFLANRLGVFRSDDKGESWSDMEIGRFSPLTYARDVKVFPHDAHTLLGAFSIAAVSDAGSLYRSPDLGATWMRFDHDVSIDSTNVVELRGAGQASRLVSVEIAVTSGCRIAVSTRSVMTSRIP